MRILATFVLSSALILGAGTAHAQIMDDERGLNSYSAVLNLLRSYGIEASAVSWGEVESMCLPLNDNGKGALAYNRCRFERARDQVIYAQDSAACDDEARAFNPDTIRYQAFVTPGAPANAASVVPLALASTPAVNDVESFRRHVFNHCMSDKGWRNPRNYRFGQTD